VKFLIKLLFAAVMFSVAAGSAVAADADKAKKQADVRKSAHAALERFYKANPKLKEQVRQSPGYAVFTTYGGSFIIGGAGGTGLAHNQKTGKDTFMNMAQASVGLQIGASETETLIIFKNVKALGEFIDKGWEFGGGAALEAGAGGKTVGAPGAGGENIIADALYYTLTKNGLAAGGAVAGTKFWKEEDLN